MCCWRRPTALGSSPSGGRAQSAGVQSRGRGAPGAAAGARDPGSAGRDLRLLPADRQVLLRTAPSGPWSAPSEGQQRPPAWPGCGAGAGSLVSRGPQPLGSARPLQKGLGGWGRAQRKRGFHGPLAKVPLRNSGRGGADPSHQFSHSRQRAWPGGPGLPAEHPRTVGLGGSRALEAGKAPRRDYCGGPVRAWASSQPGPLPKEEPSSGEGSGALGPGSEASSLTLCWSERRGLARALGTPCHEQPQTHTEAEGRDRGPGRAGTCRLSAPAQSRLSHTLSLTPLAPAPAQTDLIYE